MVKVHYFFDPMCGWCYGATSLLAAIAANSEITLELHPGGMIDNRAIEPDFRNHILASDQRIAQITGAEFGEGYIQRVKSGDEMVLDSFITARAIVTAQQLGAAPLEMLKAIQSAHYFEGKQVNRPEVLQELAASLGLDTAVWKKAFTANQNIKRAEIHKSHQLMQQLQVQGYPTLIVEKDTVFTVLPHSRFYGRPKAWELLLASHV
ncbi:DsbA family protein [Vibrio sp. SCSIO 43137]|uniref:DsbA family protein n=1 Tax=Vibrio sp. SCSIO 43137 TaxID=3021011 RepID=UPI0023079832|nr:DsbA family protein [Vibrio sp. SCSIO 43137]WCE30923.1 DsbA family protein [Vibrio sp. SCSIO 43137]